MSTGKTILHPKDLVREYKNAMVFLLSPDELEVFAQAEQDQSDAFKAKTEMLENVRSRNLSGWLDNEPESTVPEHLPTELREFVRHAYPDEMRAFADINVREGKAVMVQANLIRMAIEREVSNGTAP